MGFIVLSQFENSINNPWKILMIKFSEIHKWFCYIVFLFGVIFNE
jgi:hypothetical protein